MTLEERTFMVIHKMVIESFMPEEDQFILCEDKDIIQKLRGKPPIIQRGLYISAKKMFCKEFSYRVERYGEIFGTVLYGDWLNMYLQLMKTYMNLDINEARSIDVFRSSCINHGRCATPVWIDIFHAFPVEYSNL